MEDDRTLPEDQLVSTVKNLELFFDEIKNPQIIGKYSQVPRRYFTPDGAYDYVQVFSAFGVKQFRVNFVSNNDLGFQGLVYKLEHIGRWFDFTAWEVRVLREEPVGNVQSWVYTVAAFDATTIYWKFFAFGADNGEFSIEVLS